MALPFLAKAVAGTKTAPRNAPRSRRRGKRPSRDELVRRGRRIEKDAQRVLGVVAKAEEEARSKGINLPMLRDARSLNSDLGSAIAGVRRIRAVIATVFLSWTVLPFYIPQIMMWMLGLSGIGLEGVPIANLLFPGTELFWVSWLIIAAIGVFSMIYAAWIYTIRLVQCFSGTLTFIFICCLTAYLVPIINFAPWVLLYMLAVVLHSKKGDPEEV